MTKGSPIYVTGHQGYLGSAIIAALDARGIPWKGVDTGYYVPTGQARERGWRPQDLGDISPDDLAGCRAVIHAAALSNDPLCERFPELAQEVNVRGSLRMATSARSAGVPRFVLVSTSGVYRPGGDDWLDEDSPVDPTTVYRRSKLEAETGVLAVSGRDFTPIALRLPTLYGEAPDMRLDLVVNQFAYRGVRGLPLALHGDGRQWRPLGHVRDAADALIAAATVDPGALEAPLVNACPEHLNARVFELIDHATQTFPGLQVERREAPLAGGASYRVRRQRPAPWLDALPFQRDLGHAFEELRARLEPGRFSEEDANRAHRLAWLEQHLPSSPPPR